MYRESLKVFVEESTRKISLSQIKDTRRKNARFKGIVRNVTLSK